MAHFAQLDEFDRVIQVIVAEQEVIDSGIFGDPSSWVQTSYNTRGGIHYDPQTGEPSEDQSKSLNKNFAAIGYMYDRSRNAFIRPKESSGEIFDEESCIWSDPNLQ